MIEPADLRFDRLDGIPIARLSGEVELSNAAGLRRALIDSVSNEDSALVIDLDGVTYLDSAGIRMLFTLQRKLTDRRQRLAIVLASHSPVRRSLELSGVLATIPVFETTSEARLRDSVDT